MTNKFIRDVKEVIRRLRNRGISFDGNRQYPAIPTIDNSVESHTNALRAIREAIETHERRNSKASLDSFVRLYELEDVLGGFVPGETSGVTWATHDEVDAGAPRYKAVDPETGAYAYDRFRHVGQHEAGKGTATVTLVPGVGDVVTVDGALSNVFALGLDRNVTFGPPINPVNGQTINIHLRQDVTGGRTAEFSAEWTFANKITPTLTPDGNARDLLSCQWDEAEGVMRCSFIPNFGADYIPPTPPQFEDFSFINVGGGNEIYRDTVLTDINLRTIVGGGDISVTTAGDTIVVSYSAPVQTISVLDDLTDVNVAAPQDGDTLVWDAEAGQWVLQPASALARKWTLGATWSNGANQLQAGVNAVNAVVSETGTIVAWYLLSTGGNGSCVIDVRKVPFNEYPPLVTDSVCDGFKPSLSAQSAATDSDLSNWADTSVTAGDILQFVLESTSVFTSVQFIIVVEKSA